MKKSLVTIALMLFAVAAQAQITYSLSINQNRATLTLTNTLGVVVQNTTLNGNSGQKVLDLRNLPNGVYVLTTKCGELTQTGKIIIAK